MTRRKRTPSPSAPAKRVAFEIPASLQQFSSISRSLATHTSPSQQTTSGRPTTSPQYQTQPRPTSQSSSHSSPSFAAPQYPSPNVANKSTSQRPALPTTQPWPRPVPKPQPYATVSKPTQKVGPLQATAVSNPPRPVVTPTHVRTTSNPTPSISTVSEPTLRPGETPVLKTHPNLIASLIAKKRAENEAAGNRERWQRQQAEYQAGKSPGSQLMSELKADASRNSPNQVQLRAVSSPLPARSVPTPINHPQYSLATETHPSAAETISTPATDQSAYETETTKELPQREDGSVFGSPFSSPIAEFLERATDDAGLVKDAIGNNVLLGSSSAPQDDSASMNQAHQQSNPLWVLQNGAIKPSNQVNIPPLFSDNAQIQSQHMQSPFQRNSSLPMQQQTISQPSPPFQTGQLPQGKSGPNPPQNPQHQTQASQAYAYANAQMPQGTQGFYKLDFRSQYQRNTHAIQASTPTSSTTRQQNYPQQSFPNASGLQAIMPQPPRRVGGLGHMNVAVPYPPPGPVPTYGSAVAKSQAGGDAGPGFMTAADMVAGINTKFRVATQSEFSVPKRY